VVPCHQSKIWDRHPHAGPTPAKEAYAGPPFKVNRGFAERFGDMWVILSAKFGFLLPEDEVPGPYNITFKFPATHPIQFDSLMQPVTGRGLNGFQTVIGLGGADYRRAIEAAFSETNCRLLFPFAGLSLGRQMGAVKRATLS
jgi:hypothetical protein